MNDKVKLGTSPAGTFDVNDLWAVLKVSGIVGAAAALTHLGANIASVDFGALQTVIIPIVTVAIASAVRWLSNYTKKPV